ncbi:MAG: hypothetical protein AAGA54_05485 [Myxococcota bacterium]
MQGNTWNAGWIQRGALVLSMLAMACGEEAQDATPPGEQSCGGAKCDEVEDDGSVDTSEPGSDTSEPGSDTTDPGTVPNESCAGACGEAFEAGCSCVPECVGTAPLAPDACCADYLVECMPPEEPNVSCHDVCGQTFADGCTCSVQECLDEGSDNCCPDFDAVCLGKGSEPNTTCEFQCDIPFSEEEGCTCSFQECLDEGSDNCCPDFDAVCLGKGGGEDPLSCEGRCDQPFEEGVDQCACDADCVMFGDCCEDYEGLCT